MLILLLALLAGCDALTVTPTSFIKLNDSFTDDLTGTPKFGNGAATASAYDDRTKFLYVIGTRGNVLNIISMVDPNNPRHIRKMNFHSLTEGYPDSIAICNFGSRQYLAISFEKLGTSSRAFLKIFKPMQSEIQDLEILYNRVPLDGYDPTSMAWNDDCGLLVVVQQGRVHKINNVFDDPKAFVDIMIPGVASVTRVPVQINEADLAAANVRHVLHRCEDDPSLTSSARQDLEPRFVTVDKNNVAYIAFPKNNAMGRLNLTVEGGENYKIEFINVRSKDWRSGNIDGADDQIANPQNYPIHTFYQPFTFAWFTHGTETYLATADAGEIMRLNGAEDGCQFDESSDGMTWINNEVFSGAISDSDKAALQSAMNDNTKLGQMRFTKRHYPSDYFNPITHGFDQVTGYGGRGISILRPSTLERVYDSGDLFERVFTEPDFPSHFKAVFNADVASSASTPSSRKDNTSPTTGSTPRAIVVGEIGDTLVMVAANGHVGGIYYFTVDRSGVHPQVAYQGFYRRGNAGLTWSESYDNDNDDVGEPETKNIQWIDIGSTTEAMIAVLGNRAGSVSFYRVSVNGQ